MDAYSKSVQENTYENPEAGSDNDATFSDGTKSMSPSCPEGRNIDVLLASSIQSQDYMLRLASPPILTRIPTTFAQFPITSGDVSTGKPAVDPSYDSVQINDKQDHCLPDCVLENQSKRENKDESSLMKYPSLKYGSAKFSGSDPPEETEILAGTTSTTWKIEARFLAQQSRPLILTGLLQYSLMASSLFSVGRLGSFELGAASLGNSVASVTGYVVYQGLATGLDTLCSQAYGSGRKTLVGLHMQRMIYFLLLATVPIVILWTCCSPLLATIVPDPRQVELTSKYLRILAIGTPSFALFEAGKRFLQAQGLFSAMFYVLAVCAPLNGLLSWLFVWHFSWGFLGAPIAIVVTQSMLPLCLLLYVLCIEGRECWGGFDRRALQHWGPMIRLSLPGLVTMLAEWFLYLLVTLSSSRFSSAHLAAQSIVNTAYSICFQGAFSLAIVGTTRTANLIGSGLPKSAKVASNVALAASLVAGSAICLFVTILRYQIPRALTDDELVIQLAANILPICGINIIGDAFVTTCNGVMRAAGRQHVSSWLTLIAYYMICLPIGFGLAFGANQDLQGLWLGFTVAYAFLLIVEYCYIRGMNWQNVIEEAFERLQ